MSHARRIEDRRIVSVSQSGKVRVWGVEGNKTLKNEVQAVSGSVDDLDWSDDGQRIVAGGDGRGKVVKARLARVSPNPCHLRPRPPRPLWPRGPPLSYS